MRTVVLLTYVGLGSFNRRQCHHCHGFLLTNFFPLFSCTDNSEKRSKNGDGGYEIDEEMGYNMEDDLRRDNLDGLENEKTLR